MKVPIQIICPEADTGREHWTVNFLSPWVSFMFHVMYTPCSVFTWCQNHHISTKQTKGQLGDSSQTTPIQIALIHNVKLGMRKLWYKGHGCYLEYTK